MRRDDSSVSTFLLTETTSPIGWTSVLRIGATSSHSVRARGPFEHLAQWGTRLIINRSPWLIVLRIGATSRHSLCARGPFENLAQWGTRSIINRSPWLIYGYPSTTVAYPWISIDDSRICMVKPSTSMAISERLMRATSTLPYRTVLRHHRCQMPISDPIGSAGSTLSPAHSVRATPARLWPGPSRPTSESPSSRR